MVTISQDGIVPVAPVHPRVMQTHEKVRDFQQRVRGCIGAQVDRNAIYEQLEGWLHDLKALTLIAFRYKKQHDFFNKATNPFDPSDACPPDATPEQQFQFENNLVLTAMRVEIETFHVYASTLLDRIARIYVTYFGPTKAINANSHDAFWNSAKHHPHVTYLRPELKTEANWLQNHVDWYRNRVLVHPEGYERDGFHMKGIKSQGKENVRSFIRARVEENGVVKEVDQASETLEAIIDHLCQYLDGVVDVLDNNHADSVLYDDTRPRPERLKTAP